MFLALALELLLALDLLAELPLAPEVLDPLAELLLLDLDVGLGVSSTIGRLV